MKDEKELANRKGHFQAERCLTTYVRNKHIDVKGGVGAGRYEQLDEVRVNYKPGGVGRA